MALAARLHTIPVGARACWLSRPSLKRRRLVAVAMTGDLSSSSCGAAVVWYKHDLRVDDHPGLVAAASQLQSVVPLYVFDPRIISGLSDEMLDLLLFALKDLKRLLKDQGSDLFVGFGSSEDAIIKIVNEVKATHVFTEEDVDYNTRVVISNVESRLSATLFPWGISKIMFWKAPLYNVKNMEELPASYNTFQKLKLCPSNPTAVPMLPMLNIGLERGDLPTIDDLKSYLNDESWTYMKKISAQDILQKKNCKEIAEKEDRIEGPDNVLKISSNTTVVHKMKKFNSLFASHNGSQVKGGTVTVLNALWGYLRYLEGTGRDDWQEYSYDPGALIVLESVFNFKLPVPLNYLLEWFGGKVLFIQGVRDPLSKSKERLSVIRKYCSLASIKELDAGHCPHDERPEEVNRLLREWILTAELSNP